jgi:hypothetical protein
MWAILYSHGTTWFDLEGFETYFLQVGFKFLFAVLIAGLFFAVTLLKKQQQSHQRRSILGLKIFN